MKHHLHNVQLRRRLDATAKSYNAHAVVQKEISSRALARLEYIRQTPQRVLDLSWHQGDSEAILRKAFPQARYIASAPVLSILQQRKRQLFQKPRAVCVPFAALPFLDNSVDCIFMSLTLLWTQDWPLLLRECYRVLQPGGMLLFTTFGPDTLQELSGAFAAIDSDLHVHSFVDMHDIGDVLVQVGFENPVMDLEHVQIHYKSLGQLTTDLKKTGCANVAMNRRQSLMTPRQWQQLEDNYPKLDTDELAATFEFVYGHAWVGKQKRQFFNRETNEVSVPISSLR